MRSGAHRAGKYRKKVRGFVLPGQSNRYSAALRGRTQLESIVKQICTSPVLLLSYIAYAEQISKAKGTHAGAPGINEVQYLINKWTARGLEGPTLIEIASSLGTPGLHYPGETLILGNNHIGPNDFPLSGDFIFGTRYYLDGAKSVLTKMSLYFHVYGVSGKVKCAIYNAPGNSPTTIVAQTEEKTVSHAALQWIDFDFPGSETITDGWYYLLFWAEKAFWTRADPGTNARGVTARVYDGWPSPMPAWTPDTNRDYSIYATCTVV